MNATTQVTLTDVDSNTEGSTTTENPTDTQEETPAPPSESGRESLQEQTHINPSDYEQQSLDTVLSFTVRSEWGHFRQVDGNSVAATYRLPPRTTITGLISAVLGLQRNSYYDVFGPDTSRIAITPVTQLRTLSLPELVMGTDDDRTETHPSRGKLRCELPEPEADRQRRNYEVLVDPAYRIDVAISTVPVYNALQDALENNRVYYTPSMGKSEFIASLDYHGEETVTQLDATTDPVPVESALPASARVVVPDSDTRLRTEKMPAHMTQTDGRIHTGRKTTDFSHVTYSVNGEPMQVSPDDLPIHTTGDRNIIFL